MHLSDFDYTLPAERIAQTPIEPRDSARLLVLDRVTSELSHHHVRDLPDLLRPGDLLGHLVRGLFRNRVDACASHCR